VSVDVQNVKDKLAAVLRSRRRTRRDDDDDIDGCDILTSDYGTLLNKSHELVAEICSHLPKSYLTQVSQVPVAIIFSLSITHCFISRVLQLFLVHLYW